MENEKWKMTNGKQRLCVRKLSQAALALISHIE